MMGQQWAEPKLQTSASSLQGDTHVYTDDLIKSLVDQNGKVNNHAN